MVYLHSPFEATSGGKSIVSFHVIFASSSPIVLGYRAASDSTRQGESQRFAASRELVTSPANIMDSFRRGRLASQSHV
jgi:hypothetical protein